MISRTRKKSVELVETLLELIKISLDSGQDFPVSGFGKFSVRKKSPESVVNPATGDSLMLAPGKILTCRCSGRLRDKSNIEIRPVSNFRTYQS